MLKPRRLSIWPTLPPRAILAERRSSLPFPLADPRHRVFARARHGLWHGMRALGIGSGDVVLAPSYHHGSEIEALERAGAVCRFYGVGADLSPSEAELESLLGPEVRALYLIHYFGFPQDVGKWRAWCDHHDLRLIEDAAMALLSEDDGVPTGSRGDLALYCLYKTFALPDGGAVICSERLPYPRGGSHLGLFQAGLRTGSWLAQRFTLAATVHAWVGGDRETEWGRDFGLGDPNDEPARITTALIPRIIDPVAAERRRSNHHRLRQELGAHVELLFEGTPAGACPIAFMFRMDPRRVTSIQRIVAERGVRLARFWLVPHPSVPATGFEAARELRSSVVGLPLHQELEESDLDRIIHALRVAMRWS